MRIALIQTDVAWEDPAENHARAAIRLREAAGLGARLAVLPEMFASGFSMRTSVVAEPEGGPTERFLCDAASSLGLWILAGVAEHDGTHAHNVAALVGPDRSVLRYAKVHTFSIAGEDRHYAAGDRAVRWTVDGVRITPLICYDLRFPELFRVSADETDAYVVIASWPTPRGHHWSTLLAARAIENQAYVIGVNRVGDGGGLSYSGGSVVRDPQGGCLLDAGGAEGVFVAEIDPEVVREVRAQFPVLRDRRPFRG